MNVKININNINMLSLHNYGFLQKLNELGSNARLSCAKVSQYMEKSKKKILYVVSHN